MKRLLFIFFWSALMSINIYAQGNRFIILNYQHSRRIPYNSIDIELKSENKRGQVYYINVFTKQMEGESGWEYSNIEQTVNIDKAYFDYIYNKILATNFEEIILNNENIIGADGNTISITIGTHQNNLKITLWNPDYKSEERKTDVISTIINELFLKAGLEELL
jgi:hypothetical protein